MPKKKYYWKALSEGKSGQYKSAIIRSGKYSLIYPPNRWVKPIDGYIFIFETRCDARNFSATVKKCEARGVMKPRGNECQVNSRLFSAFWKKIFRNGSLPVCEDWPLGTLWAKSIKIIE